MKPSIQVAIADDQTLFVEAVVQLINLIDHIDITLTVNSGRELLEKIDDHQVDVLLLDLEMKDIDGREVLKRLRQKDSDIKVVILSSHCSGLLVKQYIDKGANSYISKDHDSSILIEAIETVMSKGIFIPDCLSDSVQRAEIKDKSNSIVPGDVLSRSELRVLKLLCDGNTCPMIAEQSNRSVRTIENQKRSLMQKLEVNTTIELLEYAIIKGIHEIKFD